MNQKTKTILILDAAGFEYREIMRYYYFIHNFI